MVGNARDIPMERDGIREGFACYTETKRENGGNHSVWIERSSLENSDLSIAKNAEEKGMALENLTEFVIML